MESEAKGSLAGASRGSWTRLCCAHLARGLAVLGAMASSGAPLGCSRRTEAPSAAPVRLTCLPDRELPRPHMSGEDFGPIIYPGRAPPGWPLSPRESALVLQALNEGPDGGVKVTDLVPWPVAADTFAAVVEYRGRGDRIAVFQDQGQRAQLLGLGQLPLTTLTAPTLAPSSDCLGPGEPLLAAVGAEPVMRGAGIALGLMRLLPDAGIDVVFTHELESLHVWGHGEPGETGGVERARSRISLKPTDAGAPELVVTREDGGLLEAFRWDGSRFVPR